MITKPPIWLGSATEKSAHDQNDDSALNGGGAFRNWFRKTFSAQLRVRKNGVIRISEESV